MVNRRMPIPQHERVMRSGEGVFMVDISGRMQKVWNNEPIRACGTKCVPRDYFAILREA